MYVLTSVVYKSVLVLPRRYHRNILVRTYEHIFGFGIARFTVNDFKVDRRWYVGMYAVLL